MANSGNRNDKVEEQKKDHQHASSSNRNYDKSEGVNPKSTHYPDAEFADPNETEKDYLKQPQPMSSDLESIYAGAPSTKDERDALAQERKRQEESNSKERKDLGQTGHSSSRAKQVNDQNENQDYGKDEFVDSERGNYSNHKDYQDRQGYEPNKTLEDEFPNGERNRYSHIKHGLKDNSEGEKRETGNKSSYGDGKKTPDFPSGMQNQGDDNASDPQGYGETDFDDEEVRRRQDEGKQPWDEGTGDNIDDDEQ